MADIPSVDVSLPLKYNKRPSGYAFVGYADADVAKKAVEELNEKRMAKSPEKYPHYSC